MQCHCQRTDTATRLRLAPPEVEVPPDMAGSPSLRRLGRRAKVAIWCKRTANPSSYGAARRAFRAERSASMIGQNPLSCWTGPQPDIFASGPEGSCGSTGTALHKETQPRGLSSDRSLTANNFSQFSNVPDLIEDHS